ncbi:MAG TPA: FtsL-like putative cell division protein [Saprospiraceae bacterium]|nr:FtsL-like putative cell division protein [Saprospiraceae bacterium]
MKEEQKKKINLERIKWAEKIFVNLPYIFFISALTLFYIFNNHFAEKSMRKIDKLKNEVEELRYQSMNTEKELNYESIQSELAKNLEDKGLRPATKVPVKVKSSDNE